MRSRLAPALALVSLLSVSFAGARAASAVWGPRAADPTGGIARAALAATEGLTWYGMDGHVHTDHSHDAGLFHQVQGKAPENHDTSVAEQLSEAARQGEDIGTLTDHRTYDQHYDPGYRNDDLLLIDGEEWGGYPHATVWGITEDLEQGTDGDGVCGVARAVTEAHAQDAIMGVAHPEDDRKACIDVPTLADTPIDHLEAFRNPHTDFWARNLAAGRRFAPATGSDNHFKQLYNTDGGTGLNSTFVLAGARTQAAVLDAVRRGRVYATTRTNLLRLTTMLDGDMDGTFEALTGAWSSPAGPTVRVAFRAELSVGHWLQVLDERNTILAQAPVALPDETIAFDLPAGAKLYRGQLAIEPVQRISGPNELSYEDTLRLVSAPVFLTPPAALEDGTQAVASGAPVALSDAPWAGFARIVASGGVLHAAWQQRNVPVYEVAYSRSTDDGAHWTTPVVLSGGDDARTPAIASDGDRVTVAYENHDPHRHNGSLVVRTSADGGATFGAPAVLATGAARPSLAASAGRDHLAWMSMQDGYKIRYARRDGAGSWSASVLVSSGVSYDGPPLKWTVPPQTLRHVVAALHPDVAASGDRVAVAWQDNRADPTPLRNGTPDDWGIFAAFSSDGGATWAPDRRITARHDRKGPDPTKPENVEGNPARHPDLLWASDGSLYVAYQDRYPVGRGATVFVMRSDDSGATFTAPAPASIVSAEFAYKPKLIERPGGVQVVWQASSLRRWNLRTSVSSDGGATFSPEASFTTGTGFAGYPSVADGIVLWTGEEHGSYRVFAAPA